MLAISILSHYTIDNLSSPLFVIRDSDITKIIKLLKKIKNNYEINHIYILDQTISDINELKKEFKNINIETIDHHSNGDNNCTFQLLIEKLYPEYSLQLFNIDIDFDFDFNNFDDNKIFKSISFISKYLELLSINDTQGTFKAYKHFYNKDIENIDELLKFEYFVLKNPFVFTILKYFNRNHFWIKSNNNIFYILGNTIIRQLFNNFKIKDLEFNIINNDLIIVKSNRFRYIDSHILKFVIENYDLTLNNNLTIIYIKNSRNEGELSIHLINLKNKKFNIEELQKIIDLKFIHGNNKIIAINKNNYDKFINVIKENYDKIIL
jgi:hypothetical protein